MADEGRLKPTDRVSKDEGAWIVASAVKGLFRAPVAGDEARDQSPPPGSSLQAERSDRGADVEPAAPSRPKGLWGRLGDVVNDATVGMQAAAASARERAAKETAPPPASSASDGEPAPVKPKPKGLLDRVGDAVKDATRRAQTAADSTPDGPTKPAKPKLTRRHLWILAAVGGVGFLLLVTISLVSLVMMGREVSLARTIDLPKEQYGSVHFLPDGKRAIISSSKAIHVWDLNTGQKVRTIAKREHDFIKYACDLSADGSVALAGDRKLTLYDIESGQERWSLEAGGLAEPQADMKQALTVKGHMQTLIDGQLVSIDGVRVAPPASGADLKKLQVVHAGCTLQVWDLEARTKTREFKGPSPGLWHAAISPDGGRAALWYYDIKAVSDLPNIVNELVGSPLRIWDLKAGKELLTFAERGQGVAGCLFAPDGKRLLSRHENGDLTLWDAGTGKEVRRLTGHTGGTPLAVFSADGHRVLSGGMDKTVRLWDAETGKVLHQWNSFGDKLSALALSPKGDRAITVDGDDSKMQVWNVPKR